MLKTIFGKILRAIIVILYGVEGIGKSTLAAQAPDPLFIDLECGTDQLNVARVAPPKGWEELLAMINEVAITPGICKTLVLDTIDRAEELAVQYICQKYRQTGIESFGYGKGYVYLAEEFKRLLDALNHVRDAGINVIILAHAKMRKQELPDEAGSFDRWEMKLTRQVAPMVKEWADAVLFLNYKTYVVSTDTHIKKAQGGKRVIFTSHSPVYDAKNRIGLPDEMDLSYENIAPLFQDAETLAAETPQEKVQRMMREYNVSDEEVRQIVAVNTHIPVDKPMSEYSDDFMLSTLIPYWGDVVELILQSRINNAAQASDEVKHTV